jgi:hypothetical protein
MLMVSYFKTKIQSEVQKLQQYNARGQSISQLVGHWLAVVFLFFFLLPQRVIVSYLPRTETSFFEVGAPRLFFPFSPLQIHFFHFTSLLLPNILSSKSWLRYPKSEHGHTTLNWQLTILSKTFGSRALAAARLRSQRGL